MDSLRILIYTFVFLMKFFFKPIFILITLQALFTSCIDCCSGKDYKFRIRMEVIIPKNLVVEINYHTSKLTKKNYESKSKEIEVRGSQKKQFIEICLDDEPLDLKFIFKNFQNNNDMQILNVLLENKKRQMFIHDGKTFNLYFKGENCISYLELNDKYVFKSCTGEIPSIISRSSMNERLLKELNL